jgi:hypothetical protein
LEPIEIKSILLEAAAALRSLLVLASRVYYVTDDG